MKGKILNLRNIIVSLIIVVMAAVSGISIVQYNSRNVQTNLGEAYNLTGTNIIKAGLDLAKGNTGYDCSGFVNEVLKRNGVVAINGKAIPTSVGGWSGASNYTDQNGNNHDIDRIVTDAVRKVGNPWYTAIDMTKLQMGDIICRYRTYVYIFGRI
mgnify:CR=1 FL=1